MRFTTPVKLKRAKQNAGQATIEFALTMILFFSFFMFYFQITMIFAFGNFVHYATFMAARAYLSSGPNQEDQYTRARSVIVQMLKRSAGAAGIDRFPFIARGTDGGDPGGMDIMENGRGQTWMTGVRYTFKSKLFMIPMGGTGSPRGPVNSVKLTSESFLGREPSFSECDASMTSGNGDGAWKYDNGC